MAKEGKVPVEPQETEIGREFRVCPNCGYAQGFHSMFRPSAQKGKLDWLFICPGCSYKWDVGLKVALD